MGAGYMMLNSHNVPCSEAFTKGCAQKTSMRTLSDYQRGAEKSGQEGRCCVLLLLEREGKTNTHSLVTNALLLVIAGANIGYLGANGH